MKKEKEEKKVVKEEQINTQITDQTGAEGALKAKNLQWDSTAKIGNKTVWKKGNAIIGAWDPSWGTVRTGEDLVKEAHEIEVNMCKKCSQMSTPNRKVCPKCGSVHLRKGTAIPDGQYGFKFKEGEVKKEAPAPKKFYMGNEEEE